jgi:glycosyltransferase involved in cell wall biosynthesis
MKILLATYWLIPHLGGVWLFMNQMKQRLEQMGHEVDLFGNSSDGTVFHMPNLNRSLHKDLLRPMLDAKLAGNPDCAGMLSDAWVKHYERDCMCMELSAAYFGVNHYDLIHTQDIFSTRAFSRIKSPTTPIIASLHGSVAAEVKLLFLGEGQDLNHSLSWKYHKIKERLGAESSSLTITSSRWVKQHLIDEFGVHEDRLRVIPYGYDRQDFRTASYTELPVAKPTKRRVIFFSGRLVEIKGVQYLLSALAMLKQVCSDWVCWIVGDGAKEQDLRNQCHRLGLDGDVIFFGRRGDVRRMLEHADIFVHPSILDNQPLSLIEAQLAGKPSIVSNAMGLPEMVEHGVNGYIIEVGDVIALANYMHWLLIKDELRLQMGRQAKQWAETHWNYDRMIERYMEVYREVLSRP